MGRVMGDALYIIFSAPFIDNIFFLSFLNAIAIFKDTVANSKIVISISSGEIFL